MAMPITHRRFTVDEYHRMAEAGILTEDDRVELLDGEIVAMTPIGKRHAGIVARLERLLHHSIGDNAIVWGQNPIRLDRYGEPEPDVTLLKERTDFYTDRPPRPDDVLLLIEVADTSLRYDRGSKLRAYARARIPEVWIVDLTTDRVEVYREPRDDRYTDRQVAGRHATLAPVNVRAVRVRVSEIFGSASG